MSPHHLDYERLARLETHADNSVSANLFNGGHSITADSLL